jgi:hypothetical protein
MEKFSLWHRLQADNKYFLLRHQSPNDLLPDRHIFLNALVALCLSAFCDEVSEAFFMDI